MLMQYTIKQLSTRTGLPASTLRYYESEGVLPFVKRDANGSRVYDDGNIAWVDFILALRETGMSISDIRRYVELYEQGGSTLEERRQMLVAHRLKVEQELRAAKRHLDKISYKLDLYDKLAADPGRTDIKI